MNETTFNKIWDGFRFRFMDAVQRGFLRRKPDACASG